MITIKPNQNKSFFEEQQYVMFTGPSRLLRNITDPELKKHFNNFYFYFNNKDNMLNIMNDLAGRAEEYLECDSLLLLAMKGLKKVYINVAKKIKTNKEMYTPEHFAELRQKIYAKFSEIFNIPEEDLSWLIIHAAIFSSSTRFYNDYKDYKLADGYDYYFSDAITENLFPNEYAEFLLQELSIWYDHEEEIPKNPNASTTTKNNEIEISYDEYDDNDIFGYSFSEYGIDPWEC